MDKTAAIIVGFKPEIEVLQRLISSLADQVHSLILVDNGAAFAALSGMPEQDRVHYIDMGGNAGLGAALNAGFAHAITQEAEYVVTFDQDSCASPTLISDLRSALQTVLKTDPACVAVGPSFHDRREGQEKPFPFYRTVNGKITSSLTSTHASTVISADLLITSGMCVKAAVWKAGLTYDEALFVDFTDTDWCFRATASGHTLYGCQTVKMGHALSDDTPMKLFGLTFFRYSPVRRYFYFRNTVAILKRSSTPGVWRRRLLIGLLIRFAANLIIDREKLRSLAMMIRGLSDGLRNRLGPSR